MLFVSVIMFATLQEPIRDLKSLFCIEIMPLHDTNINHMKTFPDPSAISDGNPDIPIEERKHCHDLRSALSRLMMSWSWCTRSAALIH